ncbi:MAG TPA: glycoside hydrolase family 15 protein [Thermoanaerobaculia bacterium]|nr:glycoside hydrolase family 15 protein [Thermoanaerobaculia bacterium]
MRLEDLGLIGNCQISALVHRSGSIVWCCLPRFDSEPVFSTLLDANEGGHFAVAPADGTPGTQRYVENTNVLETTFRTADGAFRVLDFAPRFHLHGRMFRPTQIFRILEPIEGAPRVSVACEPRLGWSKKAPFVLEGSHHIDFGGFARPVRLTTDIPLAYVGHRPFALTERRHVAFTWGPPIEESLAPLCDRFLGETVRHWQQWVKQCNIPPLHQAEVIRSALALKLHCFEDTGAIVAAMTTSIPEAPGSGRNWDYRYCWLRDAYYALAAFRSLGHFEEREQFIRYLLEIAAGTRDLALAPLYRIDGGADLKETIVENWPGYEGEGPVRSGNAAAAQAQNDIFGEMVLALTPIFLDDRFREERSKSSLELLLRLARKAISVAGTPDAGIWEYRTPGRIRTFSTLMCWAAADRVAAVASRHSPHAAAEFRDAAVRIRDQIVAGAWKPKVGAFVGTHDGDDLDASLLQMATLRFLPSDDARLRQTVATITDRLSDEGWLVRYRLDDGFGRPQVAFIICTFWLIEAFAVTGRIEDAREAMQRVHRALSPLGLLSEDYSPATFRMWGNFPQAYSHVGLIQAAFAASPRWSEIL